MKATAALITLTCMLCLGLAGAAPATQESEKKPVNKMCPVNKEHEVDPKLTEQYKGKIIGFCCEDCIPVFKKDPEKYMKDLK